MRRVFVHHLPDVVVIEVEGDLDLINGHDLRKVLAATLQGPPSDIVLDLSRVTSADEYGVSALSWCSEQSLSTGRTLTWSSCSRPLGQDLERVIAARHERARAG